MFKLDIEFWNEDTKKTYHDAVSNLTDHGYDLTEAAKLVTSLYYAAGQNLEDSK